MAKDEGKLAADREMSDIDQRLGADAISARG